MSAKSWTGCGVEAPGASCAWGVERPEDGPRREAAVCLFRVMRNGGLLFKKEGLQVAEPFGYVENQYCPDYNYQASFRS